MAGVDVRDDRAGRLGVEQALFTRRRTDIRFSSTLIDRRSSIDYNPPIIAPSPSSDSTWNPATELPVLISVGISVALGLAIDASDHKVRLAPTRFHSPLANPYRRPTSMGEPPKPEARAGADRRLTQEAGRFFNWIDRGEQVSLAAFPASERT